MKDIGIGKRNSIIDTIKKSISCTDITPLIQKQQKIIGLLSLVSPLSGQEKQDLLVQLGSDKTNSLSQVRQAITKNKKSQLVSSPPITMLAEQGAEQECKCLIDDLCSELNKQTEIIERLKNMTHLNLQGKSPQLGEKGISKLCAALRSNHSITTLNLSGHTFSAKNVDEIAKLLALDDCPIQTLILSGCIDYLIEVMPIIRKFEQSKIKLRSLDISNNGINNNGRPFSKLFKSLQHNYYLQTLNVASRIVKFETQECKSFMDLLRVNNTLKSIRLGVLEWRSDDGFPQKLIQFIKGNNFSIGSIEYKIRHASKGDIYDSSTDLMLQKLFARNNEDVPVTMGVELNQHLPPVVSRMVLEYCGFFFQSYQNDVSVSLSILVNPIISAVVKAYENNSKKDKDGVVKALEGAATEWKEDAGFLKDTIEYLRQRNDISTWLLSRKYPAWDEFFPKDTTTHFNTAIKILMNYLVVLTPINQLFQIHFTHSRIVHVLLNDKAGSKTIIDITIDTLRKAGCNFFNHCGKVVKR